MVDRDKIVEAIKKAKEEAKEYKLDRIIVPISFADEIVRLFEEREAVKPIKVGLYGGDTHFLICGTCKGLLCRTDNYCPLCGIEVKWDE